MGGETRRPLEGLVRPRGALTMGVGGDSCARGFEEPLIWNIHLLVYFVKWGEAELKRCSLRCVALLCTV